MEWFPPRNKDEHEHAECEHIHFIAIVLLASEHLRRHIVRCAANHEEKFKLLGKIYDKQKKWAVGSDINKINDFLVKIGTDSKINENDLRACLKNEKTQELILNERIKAQKEYNITSTPTIYINDKKYEDKHEFKSFKKQIDKLL